MIPECQHIYETGRKCRRIPKRGDDLCPGHRPHPNRSFHDEPGFRRQLQAFAHQIGSLDLLEQLAILQDTLTAVQPLFDRQSARRFPRAAYTPIARASVAVSIAFGSLHEAQALVRRLQAMQPQTAPMPSDPRHPQPHRFK